MWRNDPRDEKNSALVCLLQQVVVYGYGRQNFNLDYLIRIRCLWGYLQLAGTPAHPELQRSSI